MKSCLSVWADCWLRHPCISQPSWLNNHAGFGPIPGPVHTVLWTPLQCLSKSVTRDGGMPPALQIMVGFVVGYAIAAIATYDGKSFINQAQIQAAPGFQFLWVSVASLW